MTKVGTPEGDPAEVTTWLTRASAWQFASLACRPPSVVGIYQMRALSDSLPAPLRADAATILAVPMEDWEPEFFSVLGPAGCPACESSYERAAMAARGPLLADIAGYYAAFGYAPEPLREVPDHIAVELGFLSFLSMKIAFAQFESRTDDANVARDAYQRFFERHLGLWLGDFTAAVSGTGSDHYAAVTAWIQCCLADAAV